MDLEDRFFYRLIRVLYIFLLTICCLFGICLIALSAILPGILLIIISYASLNIIKDALLYIAFGTKMSFKWLIDIPDIFNKTQQNLTFKSNNDINVDPASMAAIFLVLLLGKEGEEKTFLNLKLTPDDPINSAASCASVGYACHIYLLLIRNKFGQEISSTVKHHIITDLNRMEDKSLWAEFINILNLIESILQNQNLYGVNLLVDNSGNAEYITACGFLIIWPSSPFSLPEDKWRNLSIAETVEHCGNASIKAVYEQLVRAKAITIAEFKSLVARMKLIPEKINGLCAYEEIAWSKNPGCFEKHLKRKCNNPIFSPEKRIVHQADVDLAREKDNRDAAILQEETIAFLKTISNTNSLGMPNFNKMREKLDELTFRTFKVGGTALEKILPGLIDTKAALWKSIKDSLSNNKELLQTLEQCDKEYKKDIEDIYLNEFVAQICRDDSPIKAELCESVLSEDITNITAFMNLLHTMNDPVMKRQAKDFNDGVIKVVKAIHSRGENIPMLAEKLKILRIDI